jgi:membrane associated rhomboid family serine protease
LFPPVIKNLLIINGLVFFAQLVSSTNSLLLQYFALWPLGLPDLPGYPQFWPWQLVTYGFLHGGITHLLLNMYALWMFGMQIESTWGSQRFAIYYFVCVIGAGIIQMLVTWGQPVPTVGASGGVFGILLAFGLMFPDQYIMLLFPPIPVKAKYLVIGYGVIELFAGVAATSSGVAHFAHLGGMLFGYLLILYWRGKLPIKPARTMY